MQNSIPPSHVEFEKKVIALVYDFDGTLSPDTMQNYTILPEYKINPNDFWPMVKSETQKHDATELLTYMRMTVELIQTSQLAVTKDSMADMAGKIELFPGVRDWFSEINNFVKEQTSDFVKVEHYIVSSGIREILLGLDIKKHFKEIYGSQFHWDQYDRPTGVDRAITDVAKTQYLFRINKGITDLYNSVNDHMPESDRRIPFSNIVYFGDGDTDVPSMAVTRKSGGYAIAVHPKDDTAKIKKCQRLYDFDRVDFYTNADYQKNSPLFDYTKTILKKIISDIRLEMKKFDFNKNRPTIE